MKKVWAAWVACVALSGCGSTNIISVAHQDDAPATPVEPAGTDGGHTDAGARDASMPSVMEVGSAAPGERNVPAPDGTAVRMVHGPQGGYHIWLSLHATGLLLPASVDALQLRYLVDHDGGVLAYGRAYVPL